MINFLHPGERDFRKWDFENDMEGIFFFFFFYTRGRLHDKEFDIGIYRDR